MREFLAIQAADRDYVGRVDVRENHVLRSLAGNDGSREWRKRSRGANLATILHASSVSRSIERSEISRMDTFRGIFEALPIA